MKHKLLNLASLATIQVSNAALPLVIFPFALGIVGADLYSKIVLSEALSLFLLAIVVYSFDVDGVAQVVGLDPAHDAEQISYIFSAITYLRLLLFACCGPLLMLVVMLIDKQLVVLAFCWMLVPLSYAIQPSWLYLGLESNVPIAVITGLSRIAAVVIVLTTVNGMADYVLVPLSIGSFYLLGAVCTFLYAVHTFGIRLVRVPTTKLEQMLWSGKHVFMGNLSVTLYRDANVVILSVMGISGAGIAAYSMAEKLVKAIQASIRPLNQLFFPKALHLAQLAREPGRSIFFQLLKITWPQLAALSVLLLGLMVGYLSFGHYIPWFQRIENVGRVAALVGLMSLSTFFGVSNFMFGIAGLNVLSGRRFLFSAILLTGALNLAICFFLVLLAGETGAAVSFVLAEALLLCFILWKYLR